ncbi:MAG: hypothetical protein HQ558_06255 [Candidatus Omnitrophica bacterium]|nr:hypothetical protein [Candidatus Omnitrophota bacterium]
MKNPAIKYLLAAIFVPLSALLLGYNYGITPNQIQVLPFIYRIADPSLFPGDYYVDTLSQFPSLFPYLMAFLSKLLELETLHLVLYFLLRYVLLIASYKLSYQLFRSHRGAMFTMFLFAFSPLLNTYGLIGHDPLMKTSLYHTSMVAPFAMIAILTFLQKRYKTTALILVFIYYINALMGNFIFVMFLFASLYLWLYGREKDQLKSIGFSFLLFLLLVLPGAIWVIRGSMAHPYEASSNFIVWLKNWYPLHYFPSTWSGFKWSHFIIFLVYFAVFFKKGFKDTKSGGIIRSFIWALFSMWTIAFVLGEFFQMRRIILLQFFRSDVFFIVLGCVFAANYIKGLIEKGSLRNFVLSALIIFALLEFNKPNYAGGIMILLLLHEFRLQALSALSKVSANGDMLLKLIRRIFILFLITLAVKDLLVYLTPGKISCFLILLTIAYIADKQRIAPRLSRQVIICVMIFSLLPYATIMRQRIKEGNISNCSSPDIYDDWKRVQLWAEENTPVDSIFIVPVYMHGFRVFSKRPVFLDWVDGAAMHWYPGFGDIWIERLGTLGYRREWMIKRVGAFCGFGSDARKYIARFIYMMLDEKDLNEARGRYGVDYIVEPSGRRLSFPVAYKNDRFYVYRIE